MHLFSKIEKTKSIKEPNFALEIKDYEIKELKPLDLLKGFSELKAITYSSSLDMLKRLVDLNYQKVRLLISLPSDFKEVKILELLRTLENSQNEIALSLAHIDFEVRYLPQNHSKIYILSGENRKRLVLGSLNFSYLAWSGNQKEEILYSDNLELIRFYEEEFERLWKNAKPLISSEKLRKFTSQKNLEVNLEIRDLNQQTLEKIKKFINLVNGLVLKNLISQIPPKALKIESQNVKKIWEKALQKAELIERERDKILASKPEKVSKVLGSEEIEDRQILFNEEVKRWEISSVIPITKEIIREDRIVSNLQTLKKIFEEVRNHGGKEETILNMVETILFAFSGAYLWQIRQREEVNVEIVPIFGILAGTGGAGKSLTLAVISKLTYNEVFSFEYSSKVIYKGIEISFGNSPANIFGSYFKQKLKMAKGIYPLLVNEASEHHLKGKALYQVIKTTSNERIPFQHGVAIMTMNIALHLPIEIARRVFFIEYSYPLKDQKVLSKKLKFLLQDLDPQIFYYFLSQTNPYEVEFIADDPLSYTRNFFKNLFEKHGIEIPISDRYIGDVESKAIHELCYVFSILEIGDGENHIKIGKNLKEDKICYIVKKEKFRYPPPAYVLIEDKGEYFYLDKHQVDKILNSLIQKGSFFSSFIQKLKPLFNKFQS